MRLSSSLTSASHSACGPFQCSFIGKFEHILAPCVHSLFTVSLLLNDSQEQKKHYFLVLFLHFLPFCFSFSVPFLFQSKWDWSRHKQPISETSRATVSPCRSQGIPAKFAAFSASPSFWVREKGCKLVSWGILLCWLQETDALQEFWKQIRLTLFSGPWLLFSLTSREQSYARIFILISWDYLVFPHRTYVHHFILRWCWRRHMLYKMFQNCFSASDLFRIMPVPSVQLVISFGMI